MRKFQKLLAGLAVASLGIAAPVSAATRSADSLPAPSDAAASRASEPALDESNMALGSGAIIGILAAIALIIAVAIAADNDSAG